MTAIERRLADEAATARLGEDIAAALKPGDLVLLEGDLGAGKTTLARGLIRSLAGEPALEVPSPTFTLVQAYETKPPVAHFDLYRLSSPSELAELGLEEALSNGAALIEWPERAGDALPAGGLRIALRHEGQRRVAVIDGPEAALSRMSRSFAMRDFLAGSGWRNARRSPLLGDASARAYEDVALPGKPSRILMNSPRLILGPAVRNGKPYAEIAHTAQSITAFVGIAKLLRGAGFAAPEVYAADLDQGFALIENLGPPLFLDPGGRPLAQRYVAAAEQLAAIHALDLPDKAEAAPGRVHAIPPFDAAAMQIEADLLIDWYLPAVTGAPATEKQRKAYAAAWAEAIRALEPAEKTLMLRDYHSPNLIWREDRKGLDRLGIIDFQDALIGPSAYDVASLATDARVTIPESLESLVVAGYVAARHDAGPFDEAMFATAYAIMAAQRNAKILGIFVRLDRRDGKPGYLKHLPRIRGYFRRALTHPALAALMAFAGENGILEERPL